MTVLKRDTLIADLLRLYLKHGPAAFRDLADCLRNPDFTKEAAVLLDSLLCALPEDKAPSKRPRKANRESLNDVIARIAQGDLEKESALNRIATALTEKHKLRSLRDIERFARENSVSLRPATKRAAAVLDMLNELALLPLNQLLSIASEIDRTDSVGSSSLEGWSDIILRQSKTPKI